MRLVNETALYPRYARFVLLCGCGCFQVNGFEYGVGHENCANGFPPDCVGRSRLQELTFRDRELGFGILTRSCLQV